MREQAEQAGSGALEALILREEVLQICFWYQGEGFGDRFTAAAVMPFLQSDPEAVAATLAELAAEGELSVDGAAYRFTEEGRRKAGRMFAETFTDFQMGTHGECNAGCCDGDEVCDHDGDHQH